LKVLIYFHIIIHKIIQESKLVSILSHADINQTWLDNWSPNWFRQYWEKSIKSYFSDKVHILCIFGIFLDIFKTMLIEEKRSDRSYKLTESFQKTYKSGDVIGLIVKRYFVNSTIIKTYKASSKRNYYTHQLWSNLVSIL
jgi:hypothetical protein